MSDFDGTLVPIEDRPDNVVASPELLKILEAFSKKSTVFVAILSGRDLNDLKEIIPLDGICLVGCHGAEVSENYTNVYPKIELEKIQSKLDRITETAYKCVGNAQGFIIERKKASVALHYRLADYDSAKSVVNDFIFSVSKILEKDLIFLRGKKVLEVRSSLVDKGLAVKRLMEKSKEFYPVYIGDDITDEDAFEVIKDVGLGVLVSGKINQNTAASCRLKNPEEVMRFLKKIQKHTY